MLKFNFDLIWKENQIFRFSCCSTREDLSIYVSIITTVRLIAIDEARVISFLGVQTDNQRRFQNPDMETCRHTKNISTKLKINS